ncbi:MAG: hypothetical protein HY319_04450 [Armatimonadetes bacterium]|nr:hypothetical protein [Armatimonadota bacterium]
MVPSEDELSRALQSALGAACSHCGEPLPEDSERCPECGALRSAGHHEPPPLSFLHQEGLDRKLKIPLENATNLRMLREAVGGVREGHLALEEYRERVARVLDAARNSLDLLQSDAVQQHLSQIPARTLTLLNQSILALAEYEHGCLRMLEYDGSRLEPAEEGFQLAASALQTIDSAEDVARQQLDALGDS